MNLLVFKKILFKVIISHLIILGIFNSNKIYSQNQTNSQISNDYLRKKNNSFYILGPGDVLFIQVNKLTKELNKVSTIAPDGTVLLERVGEIYIEGITKKELITLLNNEYKKYVKEPNVKIKILDYRSVKFFIDGEINDPGFHVIPGAYNIQSFNSNNQSVLNDQINGNVIYSEDQIFRDQDGELIFQSQNNYFPTLVDILRQSGGLTIDSDLENIQVTRINPITMGGGKITAKVNLLDSLDLKDQSQNLRILDGDLIFIPKVKEKSLNQINKSIKSNINPRFVNVFVGGQVENPGIVKVNRLGGLIDAIDMAGGPKILKGGIKFTRISLDGSYDKRKIRFNRKSKLGSYSNPYLQDGDIIFVGKSGFKLTADVISEVTNPFQGLFSAYGLYKAITD